MKKTLLLFTLLPFFAGAQQTYVPDDNFEAYLENNGMGNGIANDDSVTTANISGVTILILDNETIADLSGIADFTALTDLYCWNNNLTSLDVSNNTALTSLGCAVNQLTSLDVTQNTALEELDCSANQLTSLDVTQNTVLTALDCSDNQLTSLDVTQNTALTDLICSYNQLTSLDVTQNTALEVLDCWTNQLTSLDVSQNTSLTGLICAENQLTSLDVTQNTALEYLYCYDNQLECLNVKNGNNTDMPTCYTYINPNLSCIEVDDPVYSDANWTSIDPGVTFSTNCSNACSSAPTEIGEISPAVSLYPNPATDMITIDTEGLTGKIFEVRIYDLSGQLVDQQRNVSRNHIEINTSTFQSGMYWCTVKTNIGQTQVKFIVQ